VKRLNNMQIIHLIKEMIIHLADLMLKIINLLLKRENGTGLLRKHKISDANRLQK
jgi:hypothetical protein